MINWFKNRFTNSTAFPEFWKDYVSQFKKLNHQRVVVLDCETTGLNLKKDKILSIGAVALRSKIIYVEDHFSVFLEQAVHKAESVKIHGIVRNNNHLLLTEDEAIKKLLLFLGNATIIGHHIQFDVEMINNVLENMRLPKMKNKVVDTSNLYSKYKGIHHPIQKSLDDLCEEFNILKKDRHTALGDAFLTAQVYQRLVVH